jgi:hypothetical protein
MQKGLELANRWITKLEKFGGFNLYALALLAVIFLAYNAQFWRMGFYYDDWEGIFLYKQNFSFWQIWQYFLNDRPFSTLVHVAYNPFLGASAFGWRFFAILLNWVAILLFVKTLLLIWPKYKLHIAWIGVLLTVYPGISRILVPKTSMPHYTSLLLFTLSIFLMVQAVKNGRHRVLFTALSVVLGCAQVLIIEYFSGLELIRFFIIYYLVQQQGGSLWRNLRQTILTTIPYFLPFILFVYYKISLLPSWQIEGDMAKHSLEFLADFNANPMAALTTYANRVFQDVFYAIFYIWTKPFDPQEIEITARVTIFSWVFGALLALLVAAVIEAWVRRSNDEHHALPRWYLVPLIPLISTFVGGIPVWMIGRQVMYGAWADRFLFGMFLGSVSLVVMFVLWFVRREMRAVQHLALALLFVSAFAMQFRESNRYALNWQKQRDFFWQLKWRAPSLADKAFIVTHNAPVAYNVNYQMAFSLNMIYNTGVPAEDVRHWWYSSDEHLPAYIKQQPGSTEPLEQQFRNITFHSDMTRAVAVIYRLSMACLLVADPIYIEAPFLWPSERQIFLNSHPEMILPDDPPMPVDVFGKEPARTWCYYFQKADLARQYERWDDVLSIWREADGQGYQPVYGLEYIPFIEASARLDDWDSARNFTRRAAAATENMERVLCANWQRILETSDESPEASRAWQDINTQLGCQELQP